MHMTAKERSSSAFSDLASSYDSSIYGKYTKRMQRRILELLIKTDSASVLDMGCGTGQLLSMIAKPGITLAGVDIAPGMIAEARHKLGDTANLKVGDTEALPWEDDTFDVVVSTLSFHHYPNPTKALAEAARVIKPEGRVIIGDVWLPTPFRQLVNRFVFPFSKEGDVAIYSRRDLARMLDIAGLRLVGWELDIYLFSILVAEPK